MPDDTTTTTTTEQKPITTTTTETPPATTTSTPAKDAHLEKAMAERNAAKSRARELENQLAELRSRLDTVDQEKQERETDLARKAGEFGKVEEGYKSKLSEKDKALAEANAKLVAIERGARETSMVEAVAAKAGLEAGVVRGLLRVAADSGFENAPAELSDDLVAEAIEKMRVLAPSLFKTRSTGAANPGTTQTNGEIPTQFAGDPKLAKAFEAGRALSPNRSKE